MKQAFGELDDHAEVESIWLTISFEGDGVRSELALMGM